jgi:chromosome segregation ATPase
MRAPMLLAVCVLFLAGAAAGQTSPSDSQSLQAILAEIRQLRQDLRSATVAAQRAQILIFRLQGEEAAVRRLQDRVDSARSRLSQTQYEAKRLATEAKRNEDELNNTDDPKKQKELEEVIARFKAGLEAQTNSEQETQARLSESEDQLRVEQAKLGRLQDELDRLDKSLQEAARGAASRQ